MKRILLCIVGIVLVGLVIGSFLFDKTELVRWIQEHKALLYDWINNHYFLSVIMYISVYIVGAALSIPVSFAAMILAGFLFGPYWGTLYALCGATIGSVCAFLIVRYLFSHARAVHATQTYKTYVQHMNRHSTYVLLALRLLVFVPFFAINIIAGISRVPLITFFWTTALGIIPEVFLHVSAGHQLAITDRLRDLVSVRVILLMTGAAFLIVLPVIIKYIRRYV